MSKLFRAAFSWWLASGAVCWACHSAGPYGYAVRYAALGEEEEATEEATEYDPVMARRDPKTWAKHKVSVFGIVTATSAKGSGKSELELSVRTLEPRNLCDEGGEETCRVTVSEREHDQLTARVNIRTADAEGKAALAAGSLVRVVGRLRYATSSENAAPTLEGSYYRHWPRGEFVTTEARSYLRR